VENIALKSELSGNIIDLCPVGALTNKPAAFQARPWELKSTESIDIMDAVGTNIRIDSRGQKIIRILPREYEAINEAWIADKSRFACDGLHRQRLTQPLLKASQNVGGGASGFVEISWSDALGIIVDRFSKLENPALDAAAFVGSFADLESMTVLRDLFHKFNCENLFLDEFHRTNAAIIKNLTDFRSSYLYNTGIAATERATHILLVGVDAKREAPLLNLRIRKAFLLGATIGRFGPSCAPVNYDVIELGTSPADLKATFLGHTKLDNFKKATRPLIIIGSAVLNQAPEILPFLYQYCKEHVPQILSRDWHGISILHREASRVGALDLNFQYPTKNHPFLSSSPTKFIYLLNAENLSRSHFSSDNTFIIYQGHHGDHGASQADLILPGVTYTEKDATFMNMEGRAQVTKAAVAPPENSRLDWTILQAVSECLNLTLPYTHSDILYARMKQLIPSVNELGTIHASHLSSLAASSFSNEFTEMTYAPFQYPIEDYYMSDPISRASPTMAKCSIAFHN
jgi:NADH dehydrogenase (ubiquinone) Fe-S protein 1